MTATFPQDWAPAQDRRWGFFAAVAAHLIVFSAGSLAWRNAAEYGMDASQGAVDIELVAAPAAAPTPAPIPASAPLPMAQADDIAQPDKTPPAPALPAGRPVQPPAVPASDASSKIPGADATTLHRTGASEAFLKPGYARNPPPVYPEAARKLKQQGRVLLEVAVTAEGRVGAARVKQSSGYPLLDEAALKGVGHWRFRPASAGGLRIATSVDVPIRFQLK